MTADPIKVGLIGFGFIGKVHAQAYQSIPFAFSDPKVTARINAVLRIKTGADQEFIQSLGEPIVTANSDTFYEQGSDLIDICTPNVLHKEQALDALAHNTNLYLEKPLGMDLDQAREIAQVARSAGVLTHTAFMMRYFPGIQQAKAVIASGVLGDIYHFRAQYFHYSYNDPQRPISWRLQHTMSGGGALADLGVHIIDMTRYLMGEAAFVNCRTRTFISQRPETPESSKLIPVDVDDWALCTIGLKSGGQGIIEVTRLSGGIGDSTRMEVYGTKGSVVFDLNDPLHCKYYNQKNNQHNSGSLNFPTPENETIQARCWPSTKMSLGPFLNAHTASIYHFLQCIRAGKQSPLNFDNAVKSQEVLEAAYLSAGRNSETIKLPLE